MLQTWWKVDWNYVDMSFYKHQASSPCKWVEGSEKKSKSADAYMSFLFKKEAETAGIVSAWDEKCISKN